MTIREAEIGWVGGEEIEVVGQVLTSENLMPITYFSQGLTKDSTVIPKNDW